MSRNHYNDGGQPDDDEMAFGCFMWIVGLISVILGVPMGLSGAGFFNQSQDFTLMAGGFGFAAMGLFLIKLGKVFRTSV